MNFSMIFIKILQKMLKQGLNHESDRPLSKGKNQEVIGLMIDELGGKIKTKFVGLRENTCIY